MPLYTYVYSPTGQYVDASGRRVAVLKNGDPVPGDACCNTCGSTSCGCDAGAVSPGWSNSTDQAAYLAAQGLAESTSTGTSCGLPPVAEGVAFDNATSGLAAETVQGALDELAASGGGGASTPMVGASNSVDGAGGTVPAPLAAQQGRFLRGDGTWQDPYSGITTIVVEPVGSGITTGDIAISSNSPLYLWIGDGLESLASDTGDELTLSVQEMTGASSGSAGVVGAVPPPAAGDETKYLRGDGTWQTISIPSGGAVSDLTQTSTGVFTHNDGLGGTTTIDTRAPFLVTDPSSFSGLLSGADDTVQKALDTLDQAVGPMIGAGSGSNGATGLVPQPNSGQNKKYLRGDGTWSQPGIRSFTLTAGAGTQSGDNSVVIGDDEGITFQAEEGISLFGNDAANFISISVADFGGATPTNPGVRGAVPQPPAGADKSFLKGDGTWSPVTHQVSIDSVPSGFPDVDIDASDVLLAFSTYEGAANALTVNVSGLGTGTTVREILSTSSNDFGAVNFSAPATWSLNGGGNSLAFVAGAGHNTVRAVTMWDSKKIFVTSY